MACCIPPLKKGAKQGELPLPILSRIPMFGTFTMLHCTTESCRSWKHSKT